MANSGVRSPTARAVTTRVSSGCRYMRWWLLMAPITGPGVSRRNDRRPSSTSSRSGAACASASPCSSSCRAEPTRRCSAVDSIPASVRGSHEKPPTGGSTRARSPAAITRRCTRVAVTRARSPGVASTTPAATAHTSPARTPGSPGTVTVSHASICWTPSMNPMRPSAGAAGRTGAQSMPSMPMSTVAVSASAGSMPGPYEGSATSTTAGDASVITTRTLGPPPDAPPAVHRGDHGRPAGLKGTLWHRFWRPLSESSRYRRRVRRTGARIDLLRH